MKGKKIVAGILAAAITVSSLASETFANILGSNGYDGYYFVDVADLIGDSIDISDVYGAKVRFTDDSADIIQEGAGGTFVFSSDTDNWDQLLWCIGCGEGESHDICWDSETNSITRIEESPFFTEENLSDPGYARIGLAQLWGGDISIKSVSLLDKDGNELIAKDMPVNPVPGDSNDEIEEPDDPYPGYSSGEIEEPDDPYPGYSSGDVPEPDIDGDYTYIVLGNGTIEIIGYNGNEKNIDIPADIDGKSVTSIGSYAFSYCTGLSSVTIPYGVTSIGNDAFSDCTSLTSVTIPDSVTSIDSYAFGWCKNLKSITIPDSVTRMSDSIFAWCTNLTSVKLPKGLKYIGAFVFTGCTNLTDVTIPDGVTKIDEGAFESCRSLKSITIPDSVTFIGPSAFSKCAGLTSIMIPDSVTCIEGSIFNGCTSLESIVVAEGNENYFSVDGVLCDKYNSSLICYPAGKSDSSYNIPDSVTTIGAYAFEDCSNISNVTIHNNVKYIQNLAFFNCTSLKTITIPASVTYIGDYALGYYYDENSSYTKVDGFTLKYTKNTAGHLYAAKNGFTDETCLTTKTLEDGTLKITGYYGTDEIYNIPSEIDGKKVTQIDCYVFSGNTTLTSVTIPDSVIYVDEFAFNDCTNLTSVVIPDSITSIERYTFDNCTSLKNIVIPDSVNYIYERAFANCKSLDSIALPDSVTYIDTEAFFNCDSIKTVSIPANVTYIGDYAFGYVYDENWNYKKTDGFTLDYVKNTVGHIYALRNGFTDETCFVVSELDDGTLSIDGYAGTDETYTIPPEIDGKKVTEIGYKAFENCTSLTSVIIPEGIRSIGYGAFKGCTSLTSVNIPDSVTTVNSSAFLNCTSLKSITIPEGVQNIYDRAFGYITDTDSDEIIKDEDFVINYVSGSTGHYYAYSNGFTDEKYYTAAKFFITSEKDDGTIRIVGTTGHLRSAVIPEYIDGKKVTEISYLYEENMISDTIGIPFSYLDSVYIPKTVEYVSGRSFRSCLGISIIEVDEDNPYYTSKNNVLYNKDMTELVFHSSGIYDNVFVIPDSVKTIGAYAFEENNCIEQIFFGANVAIIEDNAFENCGNLKTISIPEGVTKIGSNAFERCVELKSVTLPESLVTVGYGAFSNCTSLTELYIPAGVTTLGEAVFSYCTGLEKVEVSENNKNYCSKSGVLFNKDMTKLLFYPVAKTDESYTVPDGVVEIGKEVFGGGKSLTEIKLPDSIKIIGYGAFEHCTSLVDINLPDSITDINGWAFDGCSSLEKVTLPKNLKVIKYGTFFNCKALKTVVLPDGLETIGAAAFDSCTSLDDVVIPDSVTVIEQSAFNSCISLGNIEMSDNVISIGPTAFEGTLFVNNQDTDVKYLANWAIDSNRNAEEITVKEGIIGLAGGIFSYNQELSKVTLPDSLRYIGNGAFIGCSELTSVTIPDGVTKLDYETFEYCGSLTEVNLPDSITDVLPYAFAYTPYLNNQTDSIKYAGKVVIGCDDNVGKIVVKDGTLAIGTRAFGYNKSITEVVLPDSLRVINDSALYDCTELKSIVIPASVKTIGKYAIGYYEYQVKDDEFKIYCYAGTAGEQYAKDNGFDYELLVHTHTFGDWKITEAATCTATGTQTRICSVCGKVETATIEKVAHEYVDTIVKPTYTAQGYTLHECSVCGYSYKDNYEDQLIVPAVTGFVSGSQTKSTAVLGWDKVSDADGYAVELYTGGKWNEVFRTSDSSVTSCTVSSLKADSTYTLRIRAFKDTDDSTAYSDYTRLAVKTKLAGVTGLKAQGVTATAIKLDWDRNTSVTGYIIEQYKGGKWTQIAVTKNNTTLTFTVKGLVEYTPYTFRVKTYKNADGKVNYSDYVTVKGTTLLGNVKTFTASATGATAIKLDWSKNDKATGYVIEQYRGGKWTAIATTKNNTTLTFTVKGLADNTAYSFRIKSYKTVNGVTDFSEYITTKAKTLLGNVKTFTAAATGATAIKLDWSKNDKATAYVIEQYKGGKWTVLATTKNNTTLTFTVKGLAEGTAYSFRIKSLRTANGVTDESVYANVKSTTLLSTVKNAKVTSTTGTWITLEWAKNDKATGYVIEQYKGGKWTEIAVTKNNTTLKFTVKGLKNDTTYSFRMKNYKNVGSDVIYSDYVRIVGKTRIPNVATFKGSAVSESEIKLDWSKNDKATGYIIEQYKGGKWTAIATINNNTTLAFTVNGLAKGTTYSFRMKSFRKTDSTTEFSEYMNAKATTK